LPHNPAGTTAPTTPSMVAQLQLHILTVETHILL
jgi:hypothetical protein